jgi:prepilin-type N-terminal cleavage/methylation domain-containing protein
MHPTGRQGFTLLEVMVASMLVTVGVGALLGTTALTIRMVVRGRQAARQRAAGIAQLETLRAQAASAPDYCGGLVDGADSSGDGTARRWRIEPAGALQEASVVVSVPVPGGRATDTLTALLWCPG